MKKVFTAIRKHLVLLGVVVFASFAVCSCSNEEERVQEPSLSDYIASAKAWLNKNYSDATLIIEWDRATRQQVEGLTFVDAPLVCTPGEYGTNDPSLLEGLDIQYWNYPVRVEFVINKEDIVASALIYSVVPTVAYMEQCSFNYSDISRTQPKNLDGVIYTFNLESEPLKIDLYANGSLTKSYSLASGDELDEEGKDFAKLMRMSHPCAFCVFCWERGHATGDCGTKWINCSECGNEHLAGQCDKNKEENPSYTTCPSCGGPYVTGTNHNCSGGDPSEPVITSCSTCGNQNCTTDHRPACSYCGVKGCNINNHPACSYCGYRDCGGACLVFCEDCGQIESSCHCYTEERCKVCNSKECSGGCGGFCVWCSYPKGRCRCD